MPVDVINTIGSGGNYSTLNLWAADCPLDLVTADERWIGDVLSPEIVVSGSTALTLTGITTDATRYPWLRAAPGASWRENADVRTNALRYNAANGAAIRVAVSYAAVFNVSVAYFRLSDLQISVSQGNSYDINITGAGAIIENCLFGGDGRNALSVGGNNANPPIVRNNHFIRVSTAELGASLRVGNLYNKAFIVNNTFVRPSNNGVSGTAINLGLAEHCIITHNAVYGFSNFLTGAYPQPIITYNALSMASLGVSGIDTTGNIFSLVVVDQIEQPSSAIGLDIRVKAGSAVIDAGDDTTSYGVTTDSTGIARTTPYDIGAWEVATSLPPFTADATSVISVTAAASAAIAIAASASGVAGAVGAAFGQVALSAHVAGGAGVAGAAAAAMAIAASRAGAAGVAGAASAAFAISAAVTGVVGTAGLASAAMTVSATAAGAIGIASAAGAAISVSAAIDSTVILTTASYIGDAVVIAWPDWVPEGRRVAIGPDVRRLALPSDRRRAAIPGDRRGAKFPD